MALTRVTSGGIAPGVVIKFDNNNTPTSPAFSFNNPSDTGTGIYQPATNELAISTGGVERLRFKSDGKIITANGTILGGTNPDFVNAKNVMLYVNQSDLNATDAIENDGGNVNRPFKSIERALLEAARRSYVAGVANDKFEAFTIMVMPGDYTIDNRPGVTGNLSTNLTFGTFENELYKFNPKNGGVIVPRGTSIVGYDLRKTVVRPKFVPDPTSPLGPDVSDAFSLSHIMFDAANMIERNRGYIQEQSQLYIASTPGYTGLNATQKAFCIRDIGYFIDGVVADLRTGGNANSFIVGEFYTNGTTNQFLNNANEISATISAFNYARDLMIKAAQNWVGSYAHTSLPGATITKTTFTGGVDFTVGSGDCSTVDSAVTTLAAIVTGIISNPDTYTTLYKKTPGIFEQTSIFKVTGGCYFWQMTFKDAATNPYKSVTYSSGIPSFTQASTTQYSHHKVVAFTYADQRTTDGELDEYYKKIDLWDLTLDGGNSREVKREEYEIVGDRSSTTTIDTVNSCSPYIFNCSLRSVFGLCGMHTDGSKVAENSFKSMVVAQFTGISLQRDNGAFYQPKDAEGDGNNPTYNDPTGATNPPIYADPDAEYRPDWRHFHIKASNGGFIQVVSVFAVGYADQFLAESGGDMSITNSNSNFGQISLRAKGSQFKSFAPASQGKITALIPPRGISSVVSNIEFYGIDYKTTWSKNGIINNQYNLNTVNTFVNNVNQFKIYLDIPGINSEDDIPELVLTSRNYATSTDETKRFLTFGSNLNYNLFRDYFTNSGVVDQSNAFIGVLVEREGGESIPYSAKINLTGSTGTAEITGNNAERQGYYWDSTVNKVYLKVNADNAATDSFLTSFIFSKVVQSELVSTVVTNSDGSVSTETVTRNIDVLEYYDGFPSTLTVDKYVDDRASTPNDLLWRIEYTIPKGSTTIPKPPEKRFTIKGTRAGNGLDGIPYTDYRFLVWDVEEISAWEKNVTDGKYYLTVIRADINKFEYNTSNTSTTITRKTLTGTVDFSTSRIEELNNYDKDVRVASNINYLYPSLNEEGPTYDIRRIWNPPQTDSKVLIEAIGAGKRVKDVSVPNNVYYRGASTPFKEVPAMTSVTAESVHRLVESLDLRYAEAAAASSSRVAVAPVVSWDSRSAVSGFSTSTALDIYGTGTSRFGPNGSQTTISTTLSQNVYGISGEPDDRRIVVVSPGATFTQTDLNNHTPCPSLPLYRPSILRASSHTWEYVGLGSGNYSTGFPNLQTRVLKNYEQFIAQGYENSGGFVASTGTNSNGDQYIGNQVVQAGGTSTVTLNVPKVRKSSESNYVEVSNIENRISNSVVNVTASAAKSSANQSALKALSNFFNTAKLSVTDRASIQNLIVNDRLFISNTKISNGEKFPEGNTKGYGFVKAARPEKTGFISTDTNDRLYVSPKYLDAWRIKRQLVSASNVSLDNNRIYIQPLSSTLLDAVTNSSAVTTTSTSIKLLDTSGIPSFGSLEIRSTLNYVNISDYKRELSGDKTYLNPVFGIELDYDSINYIDNVLTLSTKQNGITRQTYLENILGTTGYNSVIKHWTNPVENISTLSEKDVKYLRTKLTSNSVVSNLDSPGGNALSPENTATISITSTDWSAWPDRGAITLREYPSGGTLRYSTYVYYKGTSTGQLVLIRKITNASSNDSGWTYKIPSDVVTDGSNYNNLYVNIESFNVFFTGCTANVFTAERWAKEEPFIPSVETISEDTDLESATLYTPPERLTAHTGSVDVAYVNTKLPNPFSSKALGVNLQNKQAVKKFSPLSSFSQVAEWCNTIGFNNNDEVELLLKPGYYRLDDAKFPCQIKINGTGVKATTTLAGKEITRVSDGRIGGYTETRTKRGDSIYLYRTPKFGFEYSSVFYAGVSGGLESTGGFNLSNVHFLSLNEAVIKNEIIDSVYANGDTDLATARRIVRLAYFLKNTSAFPASTNAVTGGLAFTANTTAATGKSTIQYYLNSDDIMVSNFGGATDGDINSATKSNCRYIKFVLEASKFTSDAGSPSNRQKFIWARNYIIPGATLYWLPAGGNVGAATQSTKVIDVRYTNRSFSTTWDTSSTEKIEVLVSVYQSSAGTQNDGNNANYTNTIEDLNIASYTDGSDATIVIANQVGSEFTTLAYNYVLNTRRKFLPYDFAFSGTYQAVNVKYVSTLANSGATTLTLNSLEGLTTGDIIHHPSIPSGTTITLPGSGTTITLSAATTDSISADSKVTFTQFDQFGNAIPKFDRPEVYGVINSDQSGEIALVIDLNPNRNIDSTIKAYPNSYYNGAIMQFKSSTNEDGAITIPKIWGAPIYNNTYGKTIYGKGSYIVYEFNPTRISSASDVLNPSTTVAPFVDNCGISSSILQRFVTFGSFGSFEQGGGKGTGAVLGTVTVDGSGAITGIAITNGGSGYNSAAIVTISGPTPSGTPTTARVVVNSSGTITGFTFTNSGGSGYSTTPGAYTATVIDRKGYIMVNGNLVNLATTSFRSDDEFFAVCKENLLNTLCPYRDAGTTRNDVRGKIIYEQFPVSYRGLRRRFIIGGAPITGNYCSPMLNVTAVPGQNAPFTLSEVTIGAQSPSDSSANRFRGVYSGALFKLRGSNITFNSVRYRGNLSLDWTGLFSDGSKRIQSSFAYGHSVELYQIEDQNNIKSFAYNTSTYLEPTKDTDGEIVDYDSRTFPISTVQAVRKNYSGTTSTTIDGVTIQPGGLLTKVELKERYLTPNSIYYNDYQTGYVGGESGFKLRWNNTTSAVAGGNSVGESLPARSLSFLYNINDKDVTDNIFITSSRTAIVRVEGTQIAYAYVNGVTLSPTAYNSSGVVTAGGLYRLATISYSGTIPLSVATGSSIKFLTNYMSSNRTKYITTTTSRYAKVNSSSRGLLNLVDSGTAQYAINSDLKIEKTGSTTANISRSSIVYLHNLSRTGTTACKAYMSTDSSGNITTFDVFDYGSGHQKGDTFSIRDSGVLVGSNIVTSGITITAVRNLIDDITIFTPGEVIAVLPQNCFVLNSINDPTYTNLKLELQKIKSLIKPGSIVQPATGASYKIALNNASYANKPYIAVYRYINELNPDDIRANIVVMLEEPSYAPTWSSNARFDIVETDNILDYWPSTGKITLSSTSVGTSEICRFSKSFSDSTGYTLTLTRSMTEYFPTAIQDWVGIDPYDDGTSVTGGVAGDPTGFSPITIKLADPLDVTCYGFKRIRPENATLQNVTTNGYINPAGKYTTNIARVIIPSGATTLNSDFEKLSIGQVVTVPYKDTSQSVSGGVWSGITFTAGSATGDLGTNTSSNRAGDTKITGTLSVSSGTFNINPTNTRFAINGSSNSNNTIFGYVNANTIAYLYGAIPGTSSRIANSFQLSEGGYRYYNYRWLDITGSYTTANNTITVTGNTTEIATAGTYVASTTSGSNIITVTSISAGAVYKGQAISGTGIPAGTYIIGVEDVNDPNNTLTGRGGTGTYRISKNATATGTPTITGTIAAGAAEYDYIVYYPGQSGGWSRRITNKSYNSGTGVTTFTLNANVSAAFTGGSMLVYTYNAYEQNFVIEINTTLIDTIPPGTTFNIAPEVSVSSSYSYSFDSRIIDIEKNVGSSEINVYLADELPANWTSAGMRHYGYLFVNQAGWTYPRVGGSSFRVNNIIPGTTTTTIYLPNRSGRVRPGDVISYEWEEDTTGVVSSHSSIITDVGTVGATYTGYSLCTLSSATNHVLYTGYGSKVNWLSIDDIFVSHREGNFGSDGPVIDKFIYSDTGVKMVFSDYSVWTYTIPGTDSPVSPTGAGWVGNFSISRTGKTADGIILNGASAISWGRQTNTSIWQIAAPYYPNIRSSSFPWSYYTTAITSNSSIRSDYAPDRSINYDGSGSYYFQPINHSWLAIGNIYSSVNTSDYNGSTAYDLQRFKLTRTGSSIQYSLQNSSIDAGSGAVSGGSTARITEQYVLSNVIHYKPALDFEASNLAGTGTLVATSGSTAVTGTSTNFTQYLVPGDQIYTSTTGTPVWIGTVAVVNSDTSVTLVANATTNFNSTGWSYVSDYVKKAGENAPSTSLVFSGGGLSSGVTPTSAYGTAGYNVVKSGNAAFDRYNFRMGVNRRNYNQTPLLNTRGEIVPINSISSAQNVIRLAAGDLCVYRPLSINMNITRLNAKTHVERSISIVGSQINI